MPCQGVLTVDYGILSALALGRDLCVIDLRGVDGLAPLHMSNMRCDLNQSCVADVYVLCPSEGFFKPVLSAKHGPILLSLGGSFGPHLYVRQCHSCLIINAQKGPQSQCHTKYGALLW